MSSAVASTLFSVAVMIMFFLFSIHDGFVHKPPKHWRERILCEACPTCPEPKQKPAPEPPCYQRSCHPRPCNQRICEKEDCVPVECDEDPIPCLPEACDCESKPKPCRKEKCEKVKCERTVCAPEPCSVVPCTGKDCKSCSTCECDSCESKLNIFGSHGSLAKQTPFPFDDELLLTTVDLNANGVMLQYDSIGISDVIQHEVLSKLNERGDFGIPRGSSCAVVGESGRLLNLNLGNDIDKHDIIMRTGEVHYGIDSGNRTTHYLFSTGYMESPPFADKQDQDVIWIMLPFKSMDWTWMNKHLKKGYRKRALLQTDKSLLRIASPSWMLYMWKMFFPHNLQNMELKWQWPSHSMFSILFLLYSGRCEYIDVYGMGYERNTPEYFWKPLGKSSDDALHYIKTGVNGVNRIHIIDREKKVLEMLDSFQFVFNH